MEPIEIIEFSESLKNHFKLLNMEWLEKYFVVLPSDTLVLANPTETIIEKGGYIFFAKAGTEIVGTFALIKVDNRTYEIAKMAVTEKYQHQGIGKRLLTFAIQKAKTLGADQVILYSNTDLTVAVNMYAKYGFQVVPKTDFHNERANIKMERSLRESKYR